MNLITPPKLKINDVAYIISPSAGLFPFAKIRVERAVKNLSTLGLKVKFSKNASKNNGYLSASIEERVDDIHEAFNDPSCSLIMASIGGNHSNQLIEHIDYGLIKNNPKAFIGYSDNTVLHYAFMTQANLQSYYGPCFLTQFGENPNVLEYTAEHFKSALMKKPGLTKMFASKEYTDEVLDWFKNEDSKRPRKLIKNNGYIWWKEGQAKGSALPITIPSINHLLATKYMPEAAGCILMIDIPEGASIYEGLTLSDLDSWLSDLHNWGLFNKVKGLIIGRPYKYTADMIDQLKTVIMKYTKGHDYPILFNADFGHTDPMMTIPINAQVEINSDNDYFAIEL